MQVFPLKEILILTQAATFVIKAGTTVTLGGINVNNGTKIYVEPTASLIVLGNSTISGGNSDIFLDGSMIFASGNLQGAPKITGSGNITITGSVSGNGGDKYLVMEFLCRVVLITIQVKTQLVQV